MVIKNIITDFPSGTLIFFKKLNREIIIDFYDKDNFVYLCHQVVYSFKGQKNVNDFSFKLTVSPVDLIGSKIVQFYDYKSSLNMDEKLKM